MITFKYPLALLLLSVVPFMIYWHFKVERKKKGALRYSHLPLVKPPTGSFKILLRHLVAAFRIAAVALLAAGIARPQTGRSFEETSTYGVDIVLLVDISTSMMALDFQPQNRLAVSKTVLEKFVAGRKHDRVGLVVFSGHAYTLCPATVDVGLVAQILKSVDFSTVDEDGTAIGTALATAVERLKDSRAKSKVIVLMTDGSNNRGEVDPVTAAKLAAALKIKVYAVGVGKKGQVPYPVDHPFFGRSVQMVESDLDEETLTAIARETGGRFFRAQDAKALENIYKEIDRLEKTEITSKMYTVYKEIFYYFVLAAAGLLLLEIVLSNTVFRRIP